MKPLLKPLICDYSAAAIEWIEADGMGGVVGSTAINVNTRKQHALLSTELDDDTRVILLSNLQETVVDGARHLELSTNAYFGAIHPTGYMALESFETNPWPTWRYAFDDVRICKEIIMVHGEHTIIVRYTLTGVSRAMSLIIRPLLAFRVQNALRCERGCFPDNWHARGEFVECKPFENGPILYISHSGAKVETVGLWYRGFVYERDRESHLECCEDLFHPGYLAISLKPDEPCSFVFSTPSPQSVDRVPACLEAEAARRNAVIRIDDVPTDPFFEELLRAADSLIFENIEGRPDIHPGLPWGEARIYRGLLAFSGLFLVRRRFDIARDYLKGVAEHWRETGTPSKFEHDVINGHMHPADAPLWAFVAAWRYWRATGDEDYLQDVLLPFLNDVAGCYMSAGETRLTSEGLIEVGHEPGANYAPVLPLGTNALWYNALATFAELWKTFDPALSARWKDRANRTALAFEEMFSCQVRNGLADSVMISPLRRDETVRAGQVLAVGLPFCPLANPEPTVALIREHLATPFGLRSLSPRDSRYVKNGDDVRLLPINWSGSVDATWFGLYRDALKRVNSSTANSGDIFAPFKRELTRRGYGHISGAFTGDSPYEPVDYVASASALGEIIRIYARDIMKLDWVV